MTLSYAFAFFTFIASNEGFHMWVETRAHLTWGGGGRDDERDVKEVKSSEGEGLESSTTCLGSNPNKALPLVEGRRAAASPETVHSR